MGLQSWNQPLIGDTGLHLSANASLFIVLGVLAIGVIASFLFPEKRKNK